jgi:ER lumen protein retaining receptor
MTFSLAYLSGSHAQSLASKSAPSGCVVAAYALLIISGACMYHFIAAQEFSSITTMAAMLQTFAFGLLGMQIISSGHVQGISARALALDAMALVCRLSSTVWLDGYLPVDASGDWAYQAVDVCSLVLVLWLLCQVLVVQKNTYQEENDSFPIIPMAVAAVVLAAVFHPDMDNMPLFDTLWMASLNVSAIAVLPQLWLSAKAGGRMEALTAHYIVVMALSRAFSGLFMWHARHDITCQPWIEGINHGIWAIGFAHLLHMILLGDFTYYYGRSLAKGGISSSLDLGEAMWV